MVLGPAAGSGDPRRAPDGPRRQPFGCTETGAERAATSPPTQPRPSTEKLAGFLS